MWGWYTPTLFSGTPPSLSLYQKACGPQYHEKRPQIRSSNRLRKPGGPVRRIVVNRDPFRPGSRSAPGPVLSEEHGFIALVFMIGTLAGLAGGLLVPMVFHLAGGAD